jgi:hypothetical protein
VLVTGASNLNRGAWPWGRVTAALGGLMLFGVVEARTEYPVLNMGLFRANRLFTLSNVAAFLKYASTSACGRRS